MGGISTSGVSSLVIWNNTITGSDEGVTLHASENGAIVSGNTISGCQRGIAVFQYGNPKIERNLITSNTKGIAIAREALLASDEPYIENNTITDNSVDISITPFMNYAVSAKINNNIYANDNNNLNSEVSNEIDATYN
jgi:parallel beta-helix repeat protein